MVAEAQGEAERFLSVYNAYLTAQDVTTTRLYIETMQDILRNANKIVIDKSAQGSGVIPYLPLPELGHFADHPSTGASQSSQPQVQQGQAQGQRLSPGQVSNQRGAKP